MKQRISFCAPGHKGRQELFVKAGYGDFFNKILDKDVSSNSDAKISMSKLMKNYADLYGVKHTELLVNGTDAGMVASILTSVSKGGKLILGRNSHQAAYNALRLGKIQPVYMRPDYLEEYAIQGGISAEEVRCACEDNPDAEAILITSPNSYGIVSNIADIADVAQAYNKILIVDQSKGAHLKFFDAVTKMSFSAEESGADIVINSVNETLLGLSGCGLINVCTDNVDIEILSEYLAMLQTKEPSFLAIGSLNINEQIMRRWGGDMVVAWLKDLQYVYSRLNAISGVSVLENDELDVTKITISLSSMGVSGAQLEKDLRTAGIDVELVHGDYVTLVSGAGSRREDYMELVNAIRAIANNYAIGRYEQVPTLINPDFVLGVTDVPERKELVPLYRADGRVLYNPIITCPPGSAIACPGEIMNMEVIGYIAKALELEMMVSGVDEEGQIYVGIEE